MSQQAQQSALEKKQLTVRIDSLMTELERAKAPTQQLNDKIN